VEYPGNRADLKMKWVASSVLILSLNISVQMMSLMMGQSTTS